MKLNSRTNLQISSVSKMPDGPFVFRGFTKIDKHQTHVICGDAGDYQILRTIDDEIVALEILGRSLVALGHLGAVYRYDIASDHWTDWTGSLEPKDFLGRTIVSDDQLIAVGTGQRFVRFTGDGWQSVCDAMQPDEDLDLHGLCHAGDGHYWVCGQDGFLADISEDAIRRAELPNSPSLRDIAALSEAGTIATCGARGALFVSGVDGWIDASVDGIDTNFSRILTWRNAFYLSGNMHVYRLDDEGLQSIGDIQSHGLCATGDSLWSIGLNQLHRLSEEAWEEIVIQVDIPDVPERGRRYRAVPKC